MRMRIICPWHEEKTPSLVKRKNSWYCYGSCNKLFTDAEVKAKTGNDYKTEVEYEYETENVSERFQYITTLKRSLFRGLEFPTDERGYFVCWPDQSYYKYRVFEPGVGSKYIGPRGLKPPLFWANQTGSQTLYIVEGEINAMSSALAIPEHSHCSPGSASMFNNDNLTKYLPTFRKYSNIVVVLDRDVAGSKGLIEARATFLYKLPFVKYLQISPDCNEILIESGKEALRRELQGQNTQ